MIIGVLDSPGGASEARVLLTPRDTCTLVEAGAQVLVETAAGHGAGFSDAAYERAGARVVQRREEVLRRSEVLLSVARPTPEEAAVMIEGATLLGLFHLEVDGEALREAAESAGARAIALERLTTTDGRQPFRQRMSQIAGRVAAQVAARLLESDSSRGILLGGVPGVPPAAVVILGAGTLGRSAARAFSGLGASVTVLDVNTAALEALHLERLRSVTTVVASRAMIHRVASWADVLIGAVRVPDGPPPRLASPEVGKPGAVWMDLAVDDGGCIEGSRPVSGPDEAYLEHEVLCCPPG